MPIVSKPAHSQPYIEPPATARRLAEIKVLLETIRSLEVEPSLKKRMLVHGIWEVAKATDDFHGRFRSERVIRTPGLRIQRDHIHKKSALVGELLRPSPDLDSIIDRARCCIVAADEHQKLHGIDSDLDGWERYRVAGVIVYDMWDGTCLTGSKDCIEISQLDDAFA